MNIDEKYNRNNRDRTIRTGTIRTGTIAGTIKNDLDDKEYRTVKNHRAIRDNQNDRDIAENRNNRERSEQSRHSRGAMPLDGQRPGQSALDRHTRGFPVR